MPRLKRLTPQDLDADQKAVYDDLTKGERGKNTTMVNDDGSLVGPFNAMLYSPMTGNRYQSLGESLRFFNSLPANQLEIAILIIAAQWRAEFEWWAHERLARRAGVSDTIIEAIRSRATPEFTDAAEQVVYDAATELLGTHRLSDDTYRRAVENLGQKALVDLQFLLAYYTGISMLLNTFEVPLPEGIEPQFT